MVTFDCAAAAPDISISAPSAASVFRMVFLMTLSLDELVRTIGQAAKTA
jgi:hypothetical protein